jgi:hypothetical protein
MKNEINMACIDSTETCTPCGKEFLVLDVPTAKPSVGLTMVQTFCSILEGSPQTGVPLRYTP